MLLLLLLLLLCGCMPKTADLYTNFLDDIDVEVRMEDLISRTEGGEKGALLLLHIEDMRREIRSLEIEDPQIRKINQNYRIAVDHLEKAVRLDEKADAAFRDLCARARIRVQNAHTAFEAYKRKTRNQ